MLFFALVTSTWTTGTICQRVPGEGRFLSQTKMLINNQLNGDHRAGPGLVAQCERGGVIPAGPLGGASDKTSAQNTVISTKSGAGGAARMG